MKSTEPTNRSLIKLNPKLTSRVHRLINHSKPLNLQPDFPNFFKFVANFISNFSSFMIQASLIIINH